jgi:FemAB-related protein (PEP-CTERM system-associated)
MKITKAEKSDYAAWDNYVSDHSKGTLYHLSGWKEVIEKAYKHKTYYLMALQDNFRKLLDCSHSGDKNGINGIDIKPAIVGVLPLVHLKHFLFGNSLISMPFFDFGGILADTPDTEKALLEKALEIAFEKGAKKIELRHVERLLWFGDEDSSSDADNVLPLYYLTKSQKMRMLLNLPQHPEILMKSFKSKLRSQIKKPIKEGLHFNIGGMELLDDFYDVFSINMRDLGSPVHSKRLIWNVLESFPSQSKIAMVHSNNEPIACSLIVGFKDTLENPWASANRRYSKLSPNMLLYWAMLEYACNRGYRYFDFGRSSPGGGTFKFKQQWGAKGEKLYWHYIGIGGHGFSAEGESEKARFGKAVQYWQKMPVCMTKMVGPSIRKYIGL